MNSTSYIYYLLVFEGKVFIRNGQLLNSVSQKSAAEYCPMNNWALSRQSIDHFAQTSVGVGLIVCDVEGFAS